MLSQEEERTLLHEFNGTHSNYPRNKSIVDIFEEQVLASPDLIAVVFEGRELSYSELNRRSNKVARYLQGKGVTSDTLVKLFRSEVSGDDSSDTWNTELLAGPRQTLDPEYPEE